MSESEIKSIIQKIFTESSDPVSTTSKAIIRAVVEYEKKNQYLHTACSRKGVTTL